MKNYRVEDPKEFIKLGLVSFETAKEIKQEYKKLTNYSYTLNETIKEEYKEEFSSYYPWEIEEEFGSKKYKKVTEYVWRISNLTSDNKDESNIISAPSLYDLQQYLIEKYKIFVNPVFDGTYWSWVSQNMYIEDPLECFYFSGIKYDTYAEALDDGLRITIINKVN